MSRGWLAQLAPAHAPPAPGWWPPAPGWWAGAVLLVLAVLAAIQFIKWWTQPHRRHRRAALRELDRIRTSDVDGPQAAWAVESLLRRYALALYGRERVARLAGRAWVEFAVAAGAAKLAGDAGRTLLAAAFGGESGADRERWLEAAHEFIRRAPPASRLGR